ncbi:MAG: V-type ATP synthase subunit I [Candidatus Omnitrophota bacterium]
MAIAQIKKIQILGHKNDQEKVLACLQDAGLVEVTRASEVLLPEQPPAEKLADLDNRLRSLKEAIDRLGLYAAPKTSFLKSFLKVRPIVKPAEIEAAVETNTYQPILAEIKEKEAEIKQLENQAKRLRADFESLQPWGKLDLLVQDLSGSAHTRLFLGTVNQLDYTGFLREIESKNIPLFLEPVNRVKQQRYLVVISLIKHQEEVEQIMRRHNFHFFILPESIKNEDLMRLTVKQGLILLQEKNERLKLESDKVTEKIIALIPQRILLMGLYDYFFNLRSRLLAVPRLGSTGQAFLMEGWVRADQLADLETRLQKFSALAIFSREALSSEDTPVDLENKPYVEPFEVITSLYGLPARYAVDPTPFLAPFFFIFFGLCLTDAGYGLIMVITALIFLRRLKLAKPAKKILNLVLLCGISTVILGSFLGGFLGVPVKQLMLFDPLKNPLIFLIIALGLGFAQIEFGLLIKMVQNIKQKQFADAFLVRLAWILLLPSLVLIFMKLPWAKNVVFITAGSIILFSQRRIKNILARLAAGLYSLYDITKYFSEVISYSRLLALGLSTSVIAMVINTLSRQAWNIPLVGGIVMVAIFIFGHLANLAINILSGFVHSARLQYIEFFGKFFVEGGRPFIPFKKEKIYS